MAHMSVVLDKKKAEEFERSSEFKVETEGLVRSALQGAIASGQMGTIRVDPSYLQFESVLGKFKKIINVPFLLEFLSYI